MDRQKSPSGATQRQARHQARTGQVYRRFLARIEEVSGFDAGRAEKAAVAVLHALEQRLIAGEKRHLEAQLPSRLRELLDASATEEPIRPRDIDRDVFLEMVAGDVGPEIAEDATRSVFRVVSEMVSAGEIVGVVHQLPKDLRALWPEAVQQATASDEELSRAKAESRRAHELEMAVAPVSEHRPGDALANQVLALPATEQLEIFGRIAAALLRELDPAERLGLLRSLHQQVSEIRADETALESEERPSET
jgi:uncharacterized protein (DUF2267 family)